MPTSVILYYRTEIIIRNISFLLYPEIEYCNDVDTDDHKELFHKLQCYKEYVEPKKNSPQHLVWEMLKKDPKERISAAVARDMLSSLKWT